MSFSTRFRNYYRYTTLYKPIKYIGFSYQKNSNKKAIMKSPKIAAWRHRFLLQTSQYCWKDYLIVYLNKTRFDVHDMTCITWSDNTTKCYMSGPLSRGKSVEICHHSWQSAPNPLFYEDLPILFATFSSNLVLPLFFL